MSDGAAALSSDAAPESAGWQRLHPATLALAIVKLGPRTVNFLPALAAIQIHDTGWISTNSGFDRLSLKTAAAAAAQAIRARQQRF